MDVQVAHPRNPKPGLQRGNDPAFQRWVRSQNLHLESLHFDPNPQNRRPLGSDSFSEGHRRDPSADLDGRRRDRQNNRHQKVQLHPLLLSLKRRRRAKLSPLLANNHQQATETGLRRAIHRRLRVRQKLQPQYRRRVHGSLLQVRQGKAQFLHPHGQQNQSMERIERRHRKNLQRCDPQLNLDFRIRLSQKKNGRRRHQGQYKFT